MTGSRNAITYFHTHRPSEKLYGVKKIMNTQAEILGFDIRSIEEYALTLMSCPEQVQDLIKQAKNQHIFELLKIPMILLVCLVHGFLL